MNSEPTVPLSLRVDLEKTSGGVLTRLVFKERAQVRVCGEVVECTASSGDFSYRQIVVQIGRSRPQEPE